MTSWNHLFLIILLMFFSPSGFSASIKKIYKKKGIVVIDAGKDKGFDAGEKVCFFKISGKKVACGDVESATAKTAKIKVNKNRITKLRKGYDAQFDSETAREKLFIVRGYWAGALIPHVTFGKIVYLPPEDSDTAVTSSLWESDADASALGASFVGEIEIPRFASTVGIRYREYQPVEFISDYVQRASGGANQLKFVEGTILASSIGFFYDYQVISFGDITLGAGIDLDMNKVLIDVILQEENKDSTAIVSTESSLTAISLRFPVKYKFDIAFTGVTAGMNLLIPIMGKASSDPIVVDDNAKKLAAGEASATADFVKSLNHRTTIGLEVIVGAHISF